MPTNDQLASTVATLTGGSVRDFDVMGLLHQLNARCVEVLDVDASGVLLTSSGGDLQMIATNSKMARAPTKKLQAVAAANDSLRLLELYQLQTVEGPCVDCYRAASAIVTDDLSNAPDRWTQFAGLAIHAGFRSSCAVPMRVHDYTIGALSLLRTDRAAFDEVDVLVAQGLANVATMAFVQHQAEADADNLGRGLTAALNGRFAIEGATGIISETLGVDLRQALQLLRRHAHHHLLSLADAASHVVEGTLPAESINPLPSP